MQNGDKFKNISIVFLIVFFLCLIGLQIWRWFYWPELSLRLAGEDLTVLVANNENHRYKGLGGRDSFGEYDGMLFIMNEKDRIGVVMRSMRFSIDVVWFDNGKVVDIAPNLPLEPEVSENNLRVYRPRVEANTFLELPASWTSEHNLKIGDEIELIK